MALMLLRRPRCISFMASRFFLSHSALRANSSAPLPLFRQVLEGLDPLRKRPGMCIGSTAPRGLHHLVYEKLDNAVVEAQAGFASKIDVVLLSDNSVSITDNGRGRKLADAEPPKFVHDTRLRSKKFPIFSSVSRYLSSQAGARSGGREDYELDEGFSDLDAQGSEANQNTQVVDTNKLVSERVLSDEDDVENSPESELDLDIELEGGRSSLEMNSARSNIARALLNEQKPVHTLLDKYVSEGNRLDASVISHAMLTLRRRGMYRKALQFSEWLEVEKALDFTEHNYASRLDLIAKLHGIQKAERYIESIPESFRGELVYRTLLANCVSLNNLKKAEEVYNKMKQLSFATSAFTCNQMIILYKKIDNKKIADVLLYMERENVKPTLVTYRLLIETKGHWGDIAGMEQVIETMKEEHVEPDVTMKAVMAKHYIASGLKEKAKSLLMEIEGSNSTNTRSVCSMLIPLYASLGQEGEVERVWRICERNPTHDEYMAAIDAWGKLKQIDKAEAAFNKLGKKKKLSSKHYATMLRVYADNKMLKEGKDLMKRMGESGCQIGPLTWDALVKLYVEAGQVEKADSILQKLIMQQNNMIKPLFNSYMNIMEEYAKRGDVHNSEKLFNRLKKCGYSGRLSPFRTLLQAYMNSKTHPYGFRERMKAENVFPNRNMMSQLSQADPFKQNAASDILD